MDFSHRMVKMSQNYNEIRLVFDRYNACLLKSRTRKKRTSGCEIQYHIAADTNIANISLKQLLSHRETKQHLTVYLSQYAISEFKRLGIDYVVIFDSISRTNQECLRAEILHHSHEEADILLIMHCWEIARTNPFNQCIVCSPDTDVFLLLRFHYPSHPNASIFSTGS